MRLPSVSRGPARLRNIDYSPGLSEETLAFSAVLEIGDRRCRVSNAGHGGSNCVDDPLAEAALEAYAATLPPERVPEFGTDISVDADYLLSCMVDDAVKLHRDKKHRKQGYRFAARFDDEREVLLSAETAEQARQLLIRRFGPDGQAAALREL